jgi:hypothetical protein
LDHDFGINMGLIVMNGIVHGTCFRWNIIVIQSDYCKRIYIYIIVISDDFRIKIYECGITLTGYMSLYGINMEVH